jgi:hypothetical protein
MQRKEGEEVELFEDMYVPTYAVRLGLLYLAIRISSCRLKTYWPSQYDMICTLFSEIYNVH